jgi:two-component system CheB/CheR fusion protein
VLFGQHDLGQRPPFPHIDLVLCRNVLIYFTRELQRRALELFAYALRPGGYLILGKSESAGFLPENFGLVDSHLRIYRRQGSPIFLPAPRTPLGQGGAPPMPAPHPPARRPSPLAASSERSAQRVRIAAQIAERALLALPAGVVVFDPHYDILTINLTARRLLGIHASAVGEDLVHLARNLSAEAFRDLLDAGLRGEARSVRLATRGPAALTSEARMLDLSCAPLAAEPDSNQRQAVLLINDVTELIETQRRLEEEARQAHAQAEQLSAALDRTRDAMRVLEDANEQLSSENALLRAQNQELILASEESQAASEEVETLNEELQSANEELQAVNEELQATLEELNATNEDLQARTAELQAQAEDEPLSPPSQTSPDRPA